MRMPAGGASAREQLLPFLIFGGLSTAAHWGILALLASAGCNPLLATICGAVVGSVVNYLFQYHCTFSGAGAHRSAIPAYAAVVALGWAVNAAVFWCLMSGAGFSYIYAQVCATAVVTGMNFILYRKVVFNERNGRAQTS